MVVVVVVVVVVPLPTTSAAKPLKSTFVLLGIYGTFVLSHHFFLPQNPLRDFDKFGFGFGGVGRGGRGGGEGGGGWGGWGGGGMMTTLVHRHPEQYLHKSRFTRYLQYFRDGGPSSMMMVDDGDPDDDDDA